METSAMKEKKQVSSKVTEVQHGCFEDRVIMEISRKVKLEDSPEC